MSADDENPEKKKTGKTYMFFGYQPNPTGGPNPMINSGWVWNPAILKPLLRWLGIIKEKPEDTDSETKDDG